MPFGQVVIGPPGSGKSTYCLAAAHCMRSSGRAVCLVNLDAANDDLPYDCNIDVAELVSLDSVQSELGLGPNGGLWYCMEFLKSNMDWLEDQLRPHIKAGAYIMLDAPGQSELYMCGDAMQSIVTSLTQRMHINLTVVQLVDSHLCSTAHKLLSALLMCLTSMLHLELPHINVLSKVDLLGKLCDTEVVDVERMTDIRELRHQLEMEPSALSSRFAGLTTGLCDVVDNYGLLNLQSLAVDQPELVMQTVGLADQANGFSLSGLGGRNPYAQQNESASVADVQQRLAAGPEDIWTGRTQTVSGSSVPKVHEAGE